MLVVCNVIVAPLRKEPSHKAEMVSQLLLGEQAEELERDKEFSKIRCIYDGYEGWCANNQIEKFPGHAERMETGNLAFTGGNLESVAKAYLDVPYLWGGKSRYGIDCSGFTQQVFKSFGLSLPRDAYQQAELGEVVGFLQGARAGDLAFFDNEEGRITHVGILLNPDEIIHASGKVRIDSIDHHGITNRETGSRTHRLRIIKRYMN